MTEEPTEEKPDPLYMSSELRREVDRRLQKGLYLVPEHMHNGVSMYLLYGAEPGSFLFNVMSNNFTGSVNNADHINKAHLLDWAEFVYNHVPINARGSHEKVREWMRFAHGE